MRSLIVNPYDIDQCAAALHLALTMPASEQRDRMRIMRGLIPAALDRAVRVLVDPDGR